MKRSIDSSSSSTENVLSFSGGMSCTTPRHSSIEESQVESICSLVKGQLKFLMRETATHSKKPKHSVLYCMTFMPEHGGMNNESVRQMFDEVIEKLQADSQIGPYLSAGTSLVVSIKDVKGGQLDATISLKSAPKSKCSIQ